MSLPKVSQVYHPFGGGLDLLTSSMQIKEGFCIDAQNFEPEITGGYRRIDGFERYDGRPPPSSALYFYLGIVITATINIGDTLIGWSPRPQLAD